ncbi:MAG: orotate phosphoribosyltransferase [Proteobacteria bacterium]|nr:orotate phosphoribosyltransferase [Pseudomonadota bacterium]MBS0217008.1 orotate phosphoribosyltransferase [Pseudomonadota bacterium]
MRERFLELAIKADALRFGEFTLKSGRISPYFFNAGRFDTGARLAGLASCYADAIEHAGLAADVLFGPAYKGIPLATAVACELSRRGRDVGLAFNRKEAKDHGEGGTLVGASMQGKRVLVIDDVITAGTAIREALDLVAGGGGIVSGIVVALDRQEVLDDGDRRSAVQRVRDSAGVPVIAVSTLDDLLEWSARNGASGADQPALLAYRSRYGSTSTES